MKKLPVLMFFVVAFLVGLGLYYFFQNNPSEGEHRELVVAEITYCEKGECLVELPIESLGKILRDKNHDLSESYIDWDRNMTVFLVKKEGEKIIFSGPKKLLTAEYYSPSLIVPISFQGYLEGKKEIRIPLSPVRINQPEEKEYIPPPE